MWLTLFLLSFAINTIFVFYVKWLLNNFKFLGEEVEAVKELTNGFAIHLKSIYELEMFYGDTTLKELLEHSKQLVEQLGEIDYILNPEGEENEEFEIERDPDQSETP